MSDNIFNKVKEFPNRIRACAEKKYLMLLFSALFYIGGIIAGIFIDKDGVLFGYCTNNAQNYYCMIMFQENSAFSLFFSHMAASAGYFAIFFLFGITIFLYPLTLIVHFYRGYVFGGALVAFYSLFGAQGLVICLFTVVPLNIITTFALILVSPCSELCKCNDRKKFICSHGTNVILLFIIAVLGGIIELLFLVLLLRPMSFLL